MKKESAGKKVLLPALVNPAAPKIQGVATTAATPPAMGTSTMEKCNSLSNVAHYKSNTTLSFLCLELTNRKIF